MPVVAAAAGRAPVVTAAADEGRERERNRGWAAGQSLSLFLPDEVNLFV